MILCRPFVIYSNTSLTALYGCFTLSDTFSSLVFMFLGVSSFANLFFFLPIYSLSLVVVASPLNSTHPLLPWLLSQGAVGLVFQPSLAALTRLIAFFCFCVSPALHFLPGISSIASAFSLVLFRWHIWQMRFKSSWTVPRWSYLLERKKFGFRAPSVAPVAYRLEPSIAFCAPAVVARLLKSPVSLLSPSASLFHPSHLIFPSLPRNSLP